MPAYNFQARFVKGILDGSKGQTIRRRRKRATVSGDMLQLYTGQRTRTCCLLRIVVCTSVVPVAINPMWRWVRLDGHVLSAVEEREFAVRDGFGGVDEFYEFFSRYEEGVLLNELEVIYWW